MSKAGFIPPLSGRGLLDHDSDGTLNLNANFDLWHADTAPTSFLLDAPGSWSFNAPTYVVYSSDLNLPPAHLPEVAMAAGAGGGTSGGGATTSSGGATLVTNGAGLSINVVWDSS